MISENPLKIQKKYLYGKKVNMQNKKVSIDS